MTLRDLGGWGKQHRISIGSFPASIRKNLASCSITSRLCLKKRPPVGIGLQLSGHTHGGQLFPVIYISKMIYPRTPGLHKIGDIYLYVSWGIGTWGPPMRFKAPPELVLSAFAAQSEGMSGEE